MGKGTDSRSGANASDRMTNSETCAREFKFVQPQANSCCLSVAEWR
jgi:hypothetical protein